MAERQDVVVLPFSPETSKLEHLANTGRRPQTPERVRKCTKPGRTKGRKKRGIGQDLHLGRAL